MRRVAALGGLVAAAWALTWTANRSLRRVEGGSMLPLLAPGDHVLTAPVPVAGGVRRGDVVLARTPEGVVTKRVVALPGERALLVEGHLAVDGVWHDEPYALAADGGDVRLPARDGHVLLGDHRGASTDSRTFGPVPGAAIERVVLARVRPWRWLRGDAPTPRPGPRERPAARLLVLDEEDRVLLFRVTDKDRAGRSWWETPGGGVRPRETLAAAARRELAEELGRRDVTPVALGRTGRRATSVDGAPLDKLEHFFAVRVPDPTIDPSGWTAQERAEILEHRWWTADELAATDEVVVPDGLGDHVAAARRALDPAPGDRPAQRRRATTSSSGSSRPTPPAS